MATLLKEKPQLESIDSILKELGVLDKATDLDLKALDEVVAEFQKRPEIEQVDKPIMDSLFQQKLVEFEFMSTTIIIKYHCWY